LTKVKEKEIEEEIEEVTVKKDKAIDVCFNKMNNLSAFKVGCLLANAVTKKDKSKI